MAATLVDRKFTVVDRQTGKYPNLKKIASEEDWAKTLIYCDVDAFAIAEDGSLLLMDDCNNIVWCPEGRFEVVWST